jgi:hypothetical protein
VAGFRTIVMPKSAQITVTLGNHNNTSQIDGSGSSPATVSITSVNGSTIILFRGGEFADNADPVDSKGNTLTQRGTDQGYASGWWPGYGWEVWGATGVTGGAGHQESVTKTTPLREISLVMVDVIGASSIATAQGSAAAAGAGVAYNSPSIVLTGPALVLALASGDGPEATPDQTFAASAGWTIFESLFTGGLPYVPFAVASRYYSSAGTYSLQWTPVANQGASMFMVALYP